MFELITLAAKLQLSELTGYPIEAVVGVEQVQDGWLVAIDVLEIGKVPPTVDILATYHVDLDEAGELRGYRRVHRYVRGQIDPAVSG
jgi:hypothetical protein